MPAARETLATMKAATRARLVAMGFRDPPFPEGETFLPEDASILEIARALARAVEAFHSPGGYTGS